MNNVTFDNRNILFYRLTFKTNLKTLKHVKDLEK